MKKAIVYISCSDNDPEIVGSYQSLDGCSICYLKELKSIAKCTCTVDETTGWTAVKCCNICGNPIESFWINQQIEDDNMNFLGH